MTMNNETTQIEANEVFRSDKLKHSRRIHQKHNYVDKQVRIAKANKFDVKEPHRFQKKSVVNCGDPKCLYCMNPRKSFKEKTMQEKSFEQTTKWMEE